MSPDRPDVPSARDFTGDPGYGPAPMATDDGEFGVGPGGRGRAVLVGAGPGDPDLITVRGAAALRTAEVVLFDELVCDDLLALAPADAVLINVGKRGHDAPTKSQDEINKLIVEHALAGRCVVRLKGGDPFVFGRGGEEASVCCAAGVPFTVVPGVSSSISALAYAGIPITDRRHAASFAVVTGHKDPTKVSEATRWAELGTAVDTLVVLMGMRNLGELARRMIEGGKDPATPAAAVMNGTLPSQRVVTAELCGLAEAVAEAGLGAPAAIVIGNVVRLREELGWWEKRPLFGMKVLVTRTPEQAGEMALALRAVGAEPVRIPMIELVGPADTTAIDAALAAIDDYDAILFASANAVEFTLERARKTGVDLAAANLRFGCVGPQTARALLDAGLPVQIMPGSAVGGADAEALLAEILEHYPPAGRRFLLPRAERGRENLRDGLVRAGATVDAVTAYRNRRPDIDGEGLSERIATGDIAVLTFTSPSTVRHLLEVLTDEARAALPERILAAVGPTTAAALRDAGLEPTVVPERPGGRELVTALVAYVAAARSAETA